MCSIYNFFPLLIQFFSSFHLGLFFALLSGLNLVQEEILSVVSITCRETDDLGHAEQFLDHLDTTQIGASPPFKTEIAYRVWPQECL